LNPFHNSPSATLGALFLKNLPGETRLSWEIKVRRTAAVINTHQTLVPKAPPKIGLQMNRTVSPYKIISTVDIKYKKMSQKDTLQ
jgi:hypothetical protein